MKKMKNHEDYQKLDWTTLEARYLTSEKIDYIYHNAINLSNQQRETFANYEQKASIFLSACVVLSSSVFALIVFSKNITTWLVVTFVIFAFFLISTIFCFIAVLWTKHKKYTYSDPEPYFLRGHYKANLDTLKFIDIQDLQKYISEKTTLLDKDNRWIKGGIALFVITIIIPLVMIIAMIIIT